MSTTVDASPSQPHDEMELESISEQVVQYVNREVPYDESFRQSFEQTRSSLSDKLNAFLLFWDYKKVR